MTTPNNPDNLIGKQIGQFTIIEEIGRGGMATVYRATQESINRDVAVKVLPPQFLHDPGFFERFKREVNVIAQLEHPHIVPIVEYGEKDGMPFIAMRYLGGGSLRNIIASGRPQLKDLIRPVEQIAAALDHAHQQGIIHRDLKPGNVLLDVSGNAYLTDFGIARVLNSDLTGSAIIGTPAYMSPEQAKGDPLDARADVYALGVVLFELITGREPFQAETPVAMILKHLYDRVPYISEFRDDIPPDVDRVIAKATMKEPSERYSSAGALAEAFSDAVRGTAATVSIPTKDNTHNLETTEKFPPPPPRPTPARGALDGPTITPASGVSSTEVKEQLEKNQAPTRTTEPRKRKIPGWVYTFAVAGVLIVFGGLFFAGQFNSRDTAANRDPSGTAVAVLAPTEQASENNIETTSRSVFGNETVETRYYNIAIPDNLIPPENVGNRYYDIQEDGDQRTLVHGWQDVNVTTLVTLAIVDELRSDDMSTIVNTYTERYYADLPGYQEIDSEPFEDGWFRRSYRTEGFLDFPAGQMDVFFYLERDTLAVIELYSADSIGNELVPTFQRILDSFELQDAL